MSVLIEMVESMLNDDHGISEQTYQNLCDLWAELKDQPAKDKLDNILSKIKVTENRFYLPSSYED